MTDTSFDTADRIAMYVGGGLMVLAIPVMGIINVLAGYETPLYTYRLVKGGEVTTGHVLTPALAPQGAEIVASPLFTPNLRAYIAAAGMVILGLYFLYRSLVPSPREGTDRHVRATPQ